MCAEKRIVIRRMAEEDLDQVEEIERENFSTPWSRKSFSDFIKRDGTYFLVAEELDRPEKRILGYIGAYGLPEDGDITNVSVRKDCRRTGIGRKLVQELIRVSVGAGIKRLFLEVRESNHSAICLYEQEGFVRTGLRKDYYRNPLEHAIVMMRDEEAE